MKREEEEEVVQAGVRRFESLQCAKLAWFAMLASSLSVLLVATLVLVCVGAQPDDNDTDDRVRKTVTVTVAVKESPKPIDEYYLDVIASDNVTGIVRESEILNVSIESQANSSLAQATTTTRIGGQGLQCGEANPKGRKQLATNRIMGGHKVEPGQLPFQVRLNIRSRRHATAPAICGGVILDERHILTAAHCVSACVERARKPLATVSVESSSVVATIGDHSLLRTDDGQQELKVKRVIRHERYDACNLHLSQHDIALLELSQQILYKFTSDGYGSVNRPCLPAARDLAYPGQQLVSVSGWGVTGEHSAHLSDILRQVQLAMVPMQRCQEVYGARVSPASHICAGEARGGKDSCQGDSGGPLVRLTSDNRYELVGIVSFGQGCGQAETPGVYTRVASYLDWIKANL